MTDRELKARVEDLFSQVDEIGMTGEPIPGTDNEVWAERMISQPGYWVWIQDAMGKDLDQVEGLSGHTARNLVRYTLKHGQFPL